MKLHLGAHLLSVPLVKSTAYQVTQKSCNNLRLDRWKSKGKGFFYLGTKASIWTQNNYQ